MKNCNYPAISCTRTAITRLGKESWSEINHLSGFSVKKNWGVLLGKMAIFVFCRAISAPLAEFSTG